MTKGYLTSETSVHFVAYHFVWCPKYRRKVLIGKIPKRLKQLITKKAKEMNCTVRAIEVMPNHVHLFIEATPIQSPNNLIGTIKGYTSHELRKEFRELTTKLPTLWTRSYFCSTHGHVSDDMIKKYIENQKGI